MSKERIRRVVKGVGVTGITLNLDLVRVQNIAMLRDRISAWTNNSERTAEEMQEIMDKVIRILDFIAGDIESPISANLWIPEVEEEYRSESHK